MGKVFTIPIPPVAVTATQAFLEIAAGTTGMFELHEIRIGQTSDYGDTESEGLGWSIGRLTGSGSGGSTVTAYPTNLGDAFGGAVEANNTTDGAGRYDIYHDSFNIQAGLVYAPAPETRIAVPGGGFLGIFINKAPADSLTMLGTITIEEIGG